MTGRERILAVLDGKPADRLPFMPITMQFAADQAGIRYHDYLMDYRVLVEGQIAIAAQFDIDYVNCMSDPAREAADCGAKVEYFPDQPAALVETEALLREKKELASLRIPDPRAGGRMHNAVQAIALYKTRIGAEKLIEGWVEGPCAQAADLRGINALMLDFYDDPAFVRELLEFVVEMELRYARAQVEAGAEMIGIGDAAASLVGPQIYDEFIWPFEKRMVDGIHALGARVRLHICGNIRPLLSAIARLGCDLVDLDSQVPVHEARAKMGPDQVLIGNLNPVTVIRNGSPQEIRKEIARCHSEAGDRFIIGAGCEIPRDTPAENLQALGEYARSTGARHR
jgi:MtaA/CmuA family methyltransferase